VPTARSSGRPVGHAGSRGVSRADAPARPAGAGRLAAAVRATDDVRALLRFRLAGARGRGRVAAPVGLAALVTLTVLAAVLPGLRGEEYGGLARADVVSLLPSAYLAVLVVAAVSVVASGGGRELLPAQQAAAYPVSPATDHLGALLLSPLNIAWLLQCWTLLALTSFAAGPGPAQAAGAVLALAWVGTATASAQALGWAVEWVRRGPRGPLLVRGGTVVVAATAVALIATGRLTGVVAAGPTARLAAGVQDAAAGRWLPWLRLLGLVLLLGAAAVPAGSWLAHRVARRPARDELRVETADRPARPHAGTDLVALMRTDRAGIWRSVPMRRGMTMLAVLPGAVAVAGAFGWDTMGIFPGLVASGGALLFGVNSWCLDGRGALWRDSLPVDPLVAFASRALVLVEILIAAALVTLLLASVRAGLPTPAELVAVGCALVVVTLQVVSTALGWSVRSPHAVDLRSARATPAPPLVMVGYSARLALGTTVTGLLFDLTSQGPWTWSVLLSVPFLLWSGLRLRRTAVAWRDPATRARVVLTVAA